MTYSVKIFNSRTGLMSYHTTLQENVILASNKCMCDYIAEVSDYNVTDTLIITVEPSQLKKEETND